MAVLLISILLFNAVVLADYIDIEPHTGDGSYKFEYSLGNSIDRQETGVLKLGSDNEYYQTIKGSYSYSVGDFMVFVTYVADENGVRQKFLITSMGDIIRVGDLSPEAKKKLEMDRKKSLLGGGVHRKR